MILRRRSMPNTRGPRKIPWALTETATANGKTPFRSRMERAMEASVKNVQIESAWAHIAPLKSTVGASQTAQKAAEARNGSLVTRQTIWATEIAQPNSKTAEI